METLEVIVMIFVIIETVQIFFLLRTNRQTKKLIADVVTNSEYAAEVATNMLFGFMGRIIDNEEDRVQFFEFVQACAIQGAAGVQSWLKGGDGGQRDIIQVTKSGKVKPGPGLADIGSRLLEKFLEGTLDSAEKKATQAGVDAVESWSAV